MPQINILLIAFTVLIGSITYFVKRTRKITGNHPDHGSRVQANAPQTAKSSRDIVETMERLEKNCVKLYGSQSGTAEDFASRLVKEGITRFNLKAMVANLEEFDYHNLNQFPNTKVVIFVLATYGEGEPTDNAGDSAEHKPLSNLNFIAFGLGNNTYEHFNSVVRNVNKSLEKLGAKRIGKVGEGDDGAGTTEEDFLAWKELIWQALSETMGLEEREDEVYGPIFAVTEREDLDHVNEQVYLWELNKMHLEGSQCGPHNTTNPFIAPIVEAKELFNAKDRHCLHMEIDVGGSSINYSTGDHVAIWPMNSGKEVDRFLKINGLLNKRNTVLAVSGVDPATKIPFPTPTTYDAIARYYMEICAPISRQFVAALAQFAPTDEVKAEMTKLGSDKDYFISKVNHIKPNIAQLLETLADGQSFKIPFSLCIEGLSKIQPRYYSISSSSLVQPQKISITAVVDSVHPIKGVTTNYLLALMQEQHGDSNLDRGALNYTLEGPRNKYHGIHIPVHVRHSNFKLPSDPSSSIIMARPGTGVAPFRAFVQERIQQAKSGANIGTALLFFGCRSRDEDFLYMEEWEVSF
ncbi:hypothetical protein BKA64DRAFT_750550 [Cadophora sp. MPI-SDFR-AT-0126]|nr:hypothetical protein BKA64DRAFT_750550 [Leotiomycetes sp. MPI-SDFR-AT-0126]